MSPLTQWFRKWLPHASARGRKAKRRPHVPLAIEALEDRLIPTVAFKPFFGPQDTSNWGGHLSTPEVFPIFWGTWWQQNDVNRAYQQTLTQAFYNLVHVGADRTVHALQAGSYLLGISQYGTDGIATVNNGYVDADPHNEPPAQVKPGGVVVNPGAVSGEIEHVLYDLNALPNADALDPHEPIYVVVTPPDTKGVDDGGFNEPGLHKVSDEDKREEVWAGTRRVGGGTDGPLDIDHTTVLFAHELVEAMASTYGMFYRAGSATVRPPDGFGADYQSQIADNEPDNGRYLYRLGGPTGWLVQAYWSDADKQFIVPDGNSLTMQLIPHWVGSIPPVYGYGDHGTIIIIKDAYRGTFTNSTLIVDANQAGIPRDFVGNQQIVIDTWQTPKNQGVEVTLDGQTFDFEPGQLSDIQVNTANDTESILVKGTLPGVPVDINLGSGHYTVDLGHYSDHALQGAVRIDNYRGGSGVVNVDPFVPATASVIVANANGNLDVQLEPTGRKLDYIGKYNLGSQVSVFGGGHTSIEVHDELNAFATAYSLTSAGGQAILKTSASPWFSLWYTGITTVSIAGGFGSDTYNLADWVPGQSEQQLRITAGGWPGSNRSSGATTLVVPKATGAAITDNLTLDARGTDLTLDDRGAGAVGTYTVTAGAVTRDAQGRQPLIQATNFKSVTLWTGPAADVVKVLSSLVPVTVFGAGGFDQLTVGAGGDLVVDNHVGYGGPTYTITADTLTRDAHGRAAYVLVNYASLKSLTLRVGGGGTVNVERTAVPTTVTAAGGAATFNVGLASHDLGGIGDVLMLDGGPQGAALTVYDQGHANRYPAVYTITSAMLTRGENEPPPKGVVGLPQWVTATISYVHLSRLELDAADGTSNVVNVESTSATTSIYGGANTSQVNVTPTSRNLDDIGALLVIFGVSGTATLNDQANPDGRLSGVPTTYTVDDYSVRRTATYHGVKQVQISVNVGFTLNTSTNSPNAVTVSSQLPVALNCGAADAVTVLPRYGGQGPLTVNGHGGTLDLNATGVQSDFGDVFDMRIALTDQALGWTEHEHTEVMEIVDGSDLPGGHKPPPPKLDVTDTFFTGLINYSNVSALRIDGGPVDNTFAIASTAPGTPVTINATTGDRPETRKPLEKDRATINQFVVGSGTLQNIRSALTVHGAGATDTLVVDDGSAATQDMVTVTATQVGAAAGDKFFGAGGSLAYIGLPRVTLNLSQANDDVVNLTPNATTAFMTNGSPTAFQAGHGALLNLNLIAVTNPVNTTGLPGAGQWTFGNRQAVTYTTMAVPLSNVTSQLTISYGSLVYDATTGHYKQVVTIRNTSAKPIVGPLSLVLDGLSAGVKLVNQTGTSTQASPLGSPYVDVALVGDLLAVGQSVSRMLDFASPSSAITYTTRVLAGSGQR
jgi:hypothetical protein